MLNSLHLIFWVAILVLAWAFYGRSARKAQNLPLPPGPPRLPIIGNLHQAPEKDPWRTYQQWTKEYGSVFSLQYGINTIIMLGNHQAARDLLDKRSNIYSSRPRSVMAGECVSKGLRTLFMPYGEQWRAHQRLQGSYLNVRISQTYTILQDVESKQLIYELLSTSDFSNRFHRYSSSLIFALAYGKRLTSGDEPEIEAVGQVMENLVYAARVGTWIVDSLPILNYLPKFAAPWKKSADKWHEFESKLSMGHMAKAQESGPWNWSKHIKEMKEGKAMNPEELAFDVGVIYEAGSDTVTMALEIFILAMLTYPEVMKKAQSELDSVLGSDHYPSFADLTSLPYIDAVIKEVLRWRPVVAGGIPHAVIQDDEYMGYHIPKGAIVIGNHWSISLDDAVYKDPYTFNPDRWIEEPNLPLVAWGFGRRICTGQHIAKNSLFINISRMLWTFDIGPTYEIVNGSKKRLEVDTFAFSQGITSGPLPFKASFSIRSAKRAELVSKEWMEAEKDVDVILQACRRAQTLSK